MKKLLVVIVLLFILASCSKGPTKVKGTVVTPSFNPEGGTYSTAKEVSITCATSGVNIRYTLDGTEPTSESQLYVGPFQIDSTMTIQARAYKDKWSPSAIASALYRFQVASVYILPMGGDFISPQTVQIAATTPGTVIHYTTDGTEPTEASAIYTSSLVIDRNTNLKAKGYISGWTECSTVSVNFTFQVQQPTLSVAQGIYYNSFLLSLNSLTTGAVIRYTTDGTEPTETSTQYINPINIASSTTISVKAYKDGWNASLLCTGIYNLKVTTPTISPISASFYSMQNVTISSPTTGSQVYYTTDGNEPLTSSNMYSTPLQIASNTTIKTIAVKSGWSNSDIATAVYGFYVYAPEFSLQNGSYEGTQTNNITCQTPDSEIRFTTDGSEPGSNSTLYTTPLQIDVNTVLKAKAFKSGYYDSPVTTGNYNIYNYAAVPVISPPPGEYIEAISVTITCSTPEAEIRYTTNGQIPNSNSPLYQHPIVLNANKTVTVSARAYKQGWITSQTVSATYRISIPAK